MSWVFLRAQKASFFWIQPDQDQHNRAEAWKKCFLWCRQVFLSYLIIMAVWNSMWWNSDTDWCTGELRNKQKVDSGWGRCSWRDWDHWKKKTTSQDLSMLFFRRKMTGQNAGQNQKPNSRVHVLRAAGRFLQLPSDLSKNAVVFFSEILFTHNSQKIPNHRNMWGPNFVRVCDKEWNFRLPNRKRQITDSVM